jgi:oxalate---CoA ligase
MSIDDPAGWRAAPTIGELFERLAKGQPAAPALRAPGKEPIDFGGLHRRIREFAHVLRELGIRPDDRVAIVIDNGPEAAFVLLAVMSAATAAPLNPACAADEFSFYLTDLRARALIVQSQGSPAVECARDLGLPIVHVRAAGGAAGRISWSTEGGVGAAADIDVAATPENGVALVLHTSGTTARPKIVPLRHRHLMVSARNIAESLALTTSDVSLVVMPLFHIHGVMAGLLSPLSAGASANCAPPFHPGRFFEWLEGSEATYYSAVPSMHQAIVDRGKATPPERIRHRLRFVRSSSSALAPALMANLESLLGVPAVEAYGMTEAAHQIATNPLPPGSRRAGSVGRPCGVQVSIVDGRGQSLLPGEAGEIVVRGDSVIAEYENDLGASGPVFVDGWLRTGDQGFTDFEGYVHITGRLSQVINRGGEKISPDEIEDMLLGHPGVSQAVAFAVPHGSLGQEVAAAVVRGAGEPVTEPELRAHALARLAPFKIPKRIVFVTEIPRGPSGKIRRVDLAARLGVGLPGAEGQPESAPPPPRAAPPEPMDAPSPLTRLARAEWEEALRVVWQEVLRVERIGRTDNLFLDHGADSLSALSALEMLERRVGVAIEADVFAREVTIQAQATRLAIATEGAHATAISLNEGTLPSPLWMIGDLFLCSGIARHMDRDVPLRVLRDPHDSDDGTFESVEAAGRYYANLLKASGAARPIVLAGFSVGSKIAFETAARLAADGIEVRALMMVDPLSRFSRRKRVVLRHRQGVFRALGALLRRAGRAEPLIRRVVWDPVDARLGPSYLRDDSDLHNFDRWAWSSYTNPAEVLENLERFFPRRFEAAGLATLDIGRLFNHVFSRIDRTERLDPGQYPYYRGLDGASRRRSLKQSAHISRLEASYRPRAAYPGGLTLVVSDRRILSEWRSRSRDIAAHVVRCDGPDPHAAMLNETSAQRAVAALLSAAARVALTAP